MTGYTKIDSIQSIRLVQTKEYVAMKVEKEDINSMSLEREIQMLDELKKLPGIPKIIWAGNEHNHNCLVMQLLGRDLSYHLKALKRFSLKCVVNISLQIIQIIEGVHKKGIIHRDMKPENVMTGKDQESNQIFLADFGIAKFYREPDGTHVYIISHNRNKYQTLQRQQILCWYNQICKHWSTQRI
ncbi:unnamed protein product [Paramecium octaurelia]|uniref:Casein kinase I n=1 Tax=Paramecium octaurelia TaxID=43137 RepID=A0A8S1TN96_PAROT|nr:unnamed protein product [Paramecium octaurelia]